MTKNKKGFTIIEVVLVLAIAGLIFLMVFIALPALQRSQRNTQRKDDLARFITAITEYKSNNGNQSPFKSKTTTNDLVNRYIKGDGGDAQFRDPDGSDYVFADGGVAASDKTSDTGTGLDASKVTHQIWVKRNAGCGTTENTYRYSAGASDVALFYVAEGRQVLCNDNH